MDNAKKGMGRTPRIILISAVSVLLIAAIALGVIFGVSLWTVKKKGPVIMKYEGQEIRLSFYEFMLSRVKGTLKNQREDVNSSAFWEAQHPSGVTNEEYYKNLILDDCKVYLASLAIFEQLLDSGEISGLPSTYTDQIEDDLYLYTTTDYIAGSEDEFNEIISKYGVDIDVLRDIYITEAKMSYVRDYLYGGSTGSKIGEGVKEEFYQDNYYRVKHILVGNFYCKYITDEFGNEIFFDKEGGVALYDYELGVKEYDKNGNYIKDENGVAIAFDKTTGEYVYDYENGIRVFEKNDDGSVKKYMFTEAGMAERRETVDRILAIIPGDFDIYEKVGRDPTINTDYLGSFEESSGIYLSDIEKSSYTGQFSYMNEILEKLKTMEVGEIGMVEADDGYHMFMKYENDEGAYGNSDNTEYFGAFISRLVNQLFLDKCRSMFDGMKVYTDKISEIKPMKEIGVNTDY